MRACRQHENDLIAEVLHEEDKILVGGQRIWFQSQLLQREDISELFFVH